MGGPASRLAPGRTDSSHKVDGMTVPERVKLDQIILFSLLAEATESWFFDFCPDALCYASQVHAWWVFASSTTCPQVRDGTHVVCGSFRAQTPGILTPSSTSLTLTTRFL